VNSLEEIEACLKQVKWTRDGPLHLFHSISYPQTVWARKKDDYDGFATLNCELLKQLNSSFSPVLLTAMIHPVRKSHTVCVFAYPGSDLSFFDITSFGNTNFDSTTLPPIIFIMSQCVDLTFAFCILTMSFLIH
jgi:hypothetical protein